ILAQPGRLDALVNNAGFGLYGAAEDVPLDQARYQLEVNLFGPARLIQLVLPHMRERRSGTIVNVSSMGGEIAFPLGAWYHASKHALEAYSDALRQEVKRFGVEVVLIQPGLIKTEFGGVTSRGGREISGHGAYKELAEALARSTETIYGPSSRASDPSVVAGAIRKAVEATSPRPRYPVGYTDRPPPPRSATGPGPCCPSPGPCRPASSTGSPPARSPSRIHGAYPSHTFLDWTGPRAAAIFELGRGGDRMPEDPPRQEPFDLGGGGGGA